MVRWSAAGAANRSSWLKAVGPSLMHGRAHSHLDGLQIQVSRLAAPVKDDTQQLFYFARDFLLDGFRRFFSSGETVSATGRAWQILSFTSSNS